MPHYHGHGVPNQMPRPGRLPLTPPEIWGTGSHSQYGNIGQTWFDQSVHDQVSAGMIKRPVRYEYDFPPVSAPVYGQYRAHDYSYEHQVPTLPPIRTNFDLQPISRPVPEPKEEKVAGGVASSLTYKMDQMVDFVCEMSTAMFDFHQQGVQFKDIDLCRSLQATTGTSVTSAFRKYVSQILTSTRLPVSTIILALKYLAGRMEIVQQSTHVNGPDADLFQMLTTALMLASKFLDDNTFQNRSWAEVSRVSVAELNKHEVAWLIDMQWQLHFDVEGDFATWYNAFERYAEAKKLSLMQTSMQSLKLSQTESFRQPQPTRYPQTPLYTPPSHHEASFGSSQNSARPNPWQQFYPPRTLSPSSAGPSYPSTPADWFRNPSTGFGQHSMTYSTRLPPPLQILPSTQNSYYGGDYSQYTPVWSAHPIGCPCCVQSSNNFNRFGMQHAYGVQSAA